MTDLRSGHDLPRLRDEVARLREAVLAIQRELLASWRPWMRQPATVDDLGNLAAYIGLRRWDLRGLQSRLAELGLSSLGRCEGRVLPTLDAVVAALDAMLGRAPEPDALSAVTAAIRKGETRLARHARRLLGKAPSHRGTRIMVTLPVSAAQDEDFVRALLLRGMDLARINCAHDDPDTWHRMVDNVRTASEVSGRPCRILMDLAGPKLRTGAMVLQTPGLRVKPQRDPAGQCREPGPAVFDASGAPGGNGMREGPGLARHPRIAVPPDWLRRLQPGDAVSVRDARGRRRRFSVTERSGELQVLASTVEPVWLVPGLALTHEPRSGRGSGHGHRTEVGPIEALPESLVVRIGDVFVLSRDTEPGQPAAVDERPDAYAGHIPCAQPEVLDSLRPGERVFVDDGRIGARVERIDGWGAWLRVERAAPGGDRIRPEKGLNFPDSDLNLPALTAKDVEDLDFVAVHADLVGYSFVQTGADMDRLLAELRKRDRAMPGVIAKIETRKAVANLPEIMVRGAGRVPFGVMIARGDLAVEIGWERMAEIQEEILWLAEAARVPVIWATQVLEQLIKQRLPSRAEMTDAAMSERAECVMLNKGPYVLDAVAALDDVAARMRAHQRKKSARLRALHW